MDLLQTRWEAHIDHGKRRLTVIRNEWTRGIAVQLDGTQVAAKAWSWIGLGRVAGSAEIDGRRANIEVTIRPGSVCELLVDGEAVSTIRVR
jgi:hypothetical protein